MTVRERMEQEEYDVLSPQAQKAAETKGRPSPEEDNDVRTCYQRDADRILHSKSFRRLMHKTQVFLSPEGDHYRTRMTHTLEVARIARTICRGLRLNQDLAEAAAYGHDLGHTPFGHAGEKALSSMMEKPFRHNEQSLRVVDCIEKDGRGLNLCQETRIGILAHTKGHPEESREAVVVRLCDHVAYLNHDLDDAMRAGIVAESELPEIIVKRLGTRNSRRINSLVDNIIRTSSAGNVGISDDMQEVWDVFHEFLYDRVYHNPVAKGEEVKVENILRGIWEHYCRYPEKLPDDFRGIMERDGLERAVTDYVSGMTDDYAIYQYGEIFIPMAWSVK